jgi:signal peptidase II
MKPRSWPLWTYFGIALIVFLLDYVSKKMIERTMNIGDRIEVIDSFFYITSIRNRGAAFGILQEKRMFFLIITVIVVAGIVWYLIRSRKDGSRLLLSSLGMILGGAVGNFIDRALYGEVVDFLQFNFGSYTFPVFNLADTGICVGVALVILDSLLPRKQENVSNGNEESAREEQQTV